MVFPLQSFWWERNAQMKIRTAGSYASPSHMCTHSDRVADMHWSVWIINRRTDHRTCGTTFFPFLTYALLLYACNYFSKISSFLNIFSSLKLCSQLCNAGKALTSNMTNVAHLISINCLSHSNQVTAACNRTDWPVDRTGQGASTSLQTWQKSKEFKWTVVTLTKI